ncbi:MAG: SIS domain-containing protein [Candidatus Micrarchaeota archaeon]
MFPPQFEKDLGIFIQEYVQDVVAGLREVCNHSLIPIIHDIVQTISANGNIFAFGNGGSHAEADSFLFALEREVDPTIKFGSFGNPKLDGILSRRSESLFDHILTRRARKGDLVILVSASGNSCNILGASALSRKSGARTVSISANGLITKQNVPDHLIIIPLQDQQKLEEVTIATLLILARQVGLLLSGKSESIETTREIYLEKLVDGVVRIIEPELLLKIVEDIVSAFKQRAIVRVDATDGLLVAPAEHMAHNLVWDARDETREIWSNLVLSGLLPCHMTGVGNDGGCGFNQAIEVQDNGRKGDVEIVLATTLEEIKTKSLVKAAHERNMALHTICFGSDELVAPGLAQITAHLTGRLTNTRILVEQGILDQSKANDWIRKHDLALLRKKDQIRDKLVAKFGR